MKRFIDRNPLFTPILITGAYIVLDFAVDYFVVDRGPFIRAHILIGAGVLLVSYLLMLRAVRSRRQAEAVMEKARAELAVCVGERSAELERANRQLQAEIAERRRIEQALRVSEETARGLMDAALESAILTDTRGTVLAVNRVAAESLGLTVKQLEGACLFDFFPTDVAEMRRSYLEHAVATGLPARYEDSREGRLFDVSVLPVRDGEGRVIRVAAFGQDTTERNRTERALRGREEKYRLLFCNMVEGFALYELVYDEHGTPVDWQVLEVNDAYAHHTGIAPKDIVGRRMGELFPEAIQEYLPRFVSVVASQTPTSFETYAAAVGRYQRVSTFPVGDNRFASTIEDISERKRAEEALRGSEEKFAKVFRFSPDAIGIVRRDTGAILDINEAFTRLLGYLPAEVIGTAWQQLGLLPPAEAALLEELLEEHGQVTDLELDLATRSGGVATMLVSLISITVAGDACIMMIAHDITARKQSEDALRRAQTALARGIETRAALEERQRLARELHDSVSQALYGVSLGLNTALTLFDADRDRVLEALTYALSLTRAGLQEMRALIFELRPESLEMEGLVAALTKHADALRARHGLEVELNLCPEPAVPIAIKETLYRIAQEALQNAVKHAHPTRLDIRLFTTRGAVRLEVCDNGVGFDPLAPYPGHLGLHSMQERAEGHGGKLEIVSAAGCGTQIQVTLPVPGSAGEPQHVQPAL